MSGGMIFEAHAVLDAPLTTSSDKLRSILEGSRTSCMAQLACSPTTTLMQSDGSKSTFRRGQFRHARWRSRLNHRGLALASSVAEPGGAPATTVSKPTKPALGPDVR